MRMWIKRRRKKRYAIICVLLVLIMPLYFIIKRSEPIFKLRSADAAAQAIRDSVDEVLSDVLSDGNYISDGDSSLYDIDTYGLNMLRNDVSCALSRKIQDNYYTKVYISVGSLFDNPILQGLGLRIPIKIYYGSISKVDIKDEFISAGINQTKYKASLDIKLSVSVISFTFCDTRDININIPITERIIIGKVPSYYLQGK